MEEKVCILYSKNYLTAHRLEAIFNDSGFKFLYSKNYFTLKETITSYKENLICVFVEIENNDETIKLVEEAKTISDTAPLIVLSEIPSRTLFIKAIVAGATDFIVKPFEDSLLLERINKIVKSLPDCSFTYNEAAIEMIRIEHRKSQKGKYPLGFGLITFFKPVKEYSAKLEQQYRKELPEVFSNLGKSLFETDIKQLVGSQSMLVAFTFCNSEQIPIVENKITELYKKLKTEHSYFSKYMMVQVFISKFEEGIEAVDILNLLMSTTKKTIEDQRTEFYKSSVEELTQPIGENINKGED